MYFSKPSWRSLISAGESDPKNFFGGNSGSCLGFVFSLRESIRIPLVNNPMPLQRYLAHRKTPPPRTLR